MLRRITFFLISSLLLLAACQPSRPTAVTALKVEFREDGFSISDRRIIAGVQIAITATNPTTSDHVFMILSESLKKGIESLDPKMVWYQLNIPAGQTLISSFQAPQAPGEYVLICNTPGHLEKGESGKIVVVHPDYAR